MKFWNTLFWIFYYTAMFLIVWYMLQFNWAELEPLKIIEIVGIMGGMFYMADLFKKMAMDEEKQ